MKVLNIEIENSRKLQRSSITYTFILKVVLDVFFKVLERSTISSQYAQIYLNVPHAYLYVVYYYNFRDRDTNAHYLRFPISITRVYLSLAKFAIKLNLVFLVLFHSFLSFQLPILLNNIQQFFLFYSLSFFTYALFFYLQILSCHEIIIINDITAFVFFFIKQLQEFERAVNQRDNLIEHLTSTLEQALSARDAVTAQLSSLNTTQLNSPVITNMNLQQKVSSACFVFLLLFAIVRKL